MRIKRNDLKRLIENFINEEGTEPKGKRLELPSEELEQTAIGDTFAAAQTKKHGSKKDKRRLSRRPNADIQAVTDFRKGSDRGQFPPITFGPRVDDEGNLEQGKFTTVHDYHDPDPYDHSAVRRYKKDHFIGHEEKAVGDPELTMKIFDEYDEDEDTEEAIDSEYEDYSEDESFEDDSYEVEGASVITQEDEDGNERTYIDGKEVTPGFSDDIISRLRRYFSKKKK